MHLVEANLVTPAIVGRRLTINPLMILLSLSFWAWVWGTTGALLAVPLLIIIRTDHGRGGAARHRRLPVRGRHPDPRSGRAAPVPQAGLTGARPARLTAPGASRNRAACLKRV